MWAAYGVLLQYLRKRAGLNQQQLGEAIGYSLEQVASVEQGRRPAKASFTAAAERVLGAGGVLLALQDEVDRAKLPRFFRNFAVIEAEVVSRFSYDPLLVPGLLQTEGYARALFAQHCPPLSEEVQVMPAESGFHSGLNGPFVVLETNEHQHLGYIESQEVGCVVRDPAEVSAFGLRYGKLRSKALNGVESARLIQRLVGET